MCNVSEIGVEGGLVNAAGGRGAVWMCSPCFALAREPMPCTRCDAPVARTNIIANRSEKPSMVCDACVRTCPCCHRSELQSGNVHRPNIAPGVPPAHNFCRSCYDMASRAIIHCPGHADLKVNRVTDEEIANALAALPSNLTRQRNALTVLQAVRMQWAPRA
jgi:hypothetical protein